MARANTRGLPDQDPGPRVEQCDSDGDSVFRWYGNRLLGCTLQRRDTTAVPRYIMLNIPVVYARIVR